MILVTGATGHVGSHAAIQLRDSGVPVRALVRDVRKARQMLGGDVDLADGDFEDRESVLQALSGVDAVLLSSGTHPNQADHEIAVIDAAVEAGVGRLVKISTVGAEPGSECAFLDRHGRSEDHLQRADIRWVIVRGSGFYMTNLLFFADQIRDENTIFAPAGGARIAMVDPLDVASAAVVALTAEGHDHQVYTLTGPAAITFDDVALELSRMLERQIDFVAVSDEAALQGMAEAGIPAVIAEPFVVLFRLLRGGLNSETTDAVRELTGRDPRSFAEFAQPYLAAFRG